MNTPIITYTHEVVNADAKIQRHLYTIEQGRDVCKSSFKLEHGLTPRRVANGALFNNDTLRYVSKGYKPSTTTVGLLYRGAERKYDNVPYVWKKDHRKIWRRMIRRKDFLALPAFLQHVAEANGVNVDADYITFSRCMMAWSGVKLHSGLHVHHINMDPTDDRLGNLQVVTAAEHQRLHHDTCSLVWDKDWYEYTSTDGSMLRACMAVTLDEDDIALPIKHDDEPVWEYSEDSPSFEDVMAAFVAEFGSLRSMQVAPT